MYKALRISIFFALLIVCIGVGCRAAAIEVLGVKVVKDDLQITLKNPTPDTLYLFDSYFNIGSHSASTTIDSIGIVNGVLRISYSENTDTLSPRNTYPLSTWNDEIGERVPIYFPPHPALSPALHRYDKKTKQFNLSFVPLHPFLWFERHHEAVYYGGEYVLSVKRNFLYHFKIIAPGETKIINLPLEALKSTTYIKETFFDHYSVFDVGRLKKIKAVKEVPTDFVNLKFAIYENVAEIFNGDKWLTTDVNRYNQKLNDYYILTLKIILKDMTLDDWTITHFSDKH